MKREELLLTDAGQPGAPTPLVRGEEAEDDRISVGQQSRRRSIVFCIVGERRKTEYAIGEGLTPSLPLHSLCYSCGEECVCGELDSHLLLVPYLLTYLLS